MVTTRSADKRIDNNRDEDLVLRSRKVASPASNASTPSQSRKRTGASRVQVNVPPSKRTRFGYDGIDDEEDTIVVNIPDSQNTEISSALLAESNTPDDLKDVGTPSAIGMSISGDNYGPTPTPEIFQTPATSKYRRFESEEPDVDTIIVKQSQDTDPSVHLEVYETADEEIEDSDEAPEVEALNTLSSRMSRKSAHKVKADPKPQGTREIQLSRGQQTHGRVNEDGDKTLETMKETQPEPITASPTLSTDDGSLNQNSLSDSDQADALSRTIEHNAITIQSPSSQSSAQPDTANPAKSQQQLDSPSSSIAARLPAEPKIGQHIRLDTHTSSVHTVPAYPSPLPTQLINPTRRNVASQQNDTPTSTSRLPDRARHSRETFRQNRLGQRVQRSAGGFKLESSWAKKRSAFITS